MEKNSMSLLADLLSKKENNSGNREVSPTLSRAHYRGKAGKAPEIRYLVMSALGIAAIVIGGAAVYYVGNIRPVPRSPSPAQDLSQPVAVQPEQNSRNMQVAVKTEIKEEVKTAPVAPPDIVLKAQTAQAPVSVKEPASSAKAMPAGKPAHSAVKTAAAPLPKADSVSQNWKPVKQRSAARKTEKGESVSAQKRSGATPPKTAEMTAASAVVSSPEPRRDLATRDSRLMSAQSSESDQDYPTALSHYRAALEIDPDNYRIMNNMAGMLLKNGAAGQALDKAKMALSRKPDYIPALMNAGIASSRTGNNEEAVKYMNIAADLHPENRGVRLNLGIMQERVGRLEDALATYRKLAAEGDPSGLQGVGRIYERQGKQAEAVAAYRQILSLQGINPSMSKEVRESLNRLQ